MHLKSLRVFCDVVRRKSFSRAAGENAISQSAASQMVQHLEERLGVKLIDRSKRPFVLTPEGEVYYDGCRSLIERYGALEERVRSLHQEVDGRVTVASIYSIGLHSMNQTIQQFLGRFPRANVRLEYYHPDRVYENVEQDIADIGLVSYPRASRTIDALTWREEPMVLVCAAGHALAGRSSVDLSELHGLRMVTFDRGLTIRREVDRVLHQHRVEVQVVMEFDNIETIKRAIEIDAGVGLLPLPTVRNEAKAGTLHVAELTGYPLVRPIGIIHRRGKDLSQSAVRFIDLLRESSASEDFSPRRALASDRADEQVFPLNDLLGHVPDDDVPDNDVPDDDGQDVDSLDVGELNNALASHSVNDEHSGNGSALLKSPDELLHSRQSSKQVPR